MIEKCSSKVVFIVKHFDKTATGWLFNVTSSLFWANFLCGNSWKAKDKHKMWEGVLGNGSGLESVRG